MSNGETESRRDAKGFQAKSQRCKGRNLMIFAVLAAWREIPLRLGVRGLFLSRLLDR